MIKSFVDKYDKYKEELQAKYTKEHPESYDAIVEDVITVLGKKEESYNQIPDPTRITVIDHGGYQGTKLYVIAEQGYQPSTFWSIFVDYGSCSGCDTFKNIRDYSNEAPNASQVKDYMSLALHMVQGMKLVGESK